MRIELVATKQGESLTFDFSGAPDQVSTGVNCSYWATWGSVFGSLFPMLAYDMVWNDGIFNCIKLVAPEGTLVNARRPAPVSLATIGVVQIVRNLVLVALSKMLGASEKHHRRATGLWQPTNMIYHLSGTTLEGEHLGHHGTDTFSGSGGARSFRDGVDNGGMLHAPVARCANVERHEMSFPHRYLYRRAVPDFGGPGKYRGGVCHEYAVVPHRAQGDKFTAVLMPGRGAEAPNSQGMFGGYPGCNTAFIQFRNAANRQVAFDLASTQSERQEYIGLGVTDIGPTDIQYIRYDGAGGYGDPLDRDPELVLKDVLWGLVSEAAARDVYGVCMDTAGGQVDAEATDARRTDLRQERLGGHTPKRETHIRHQIASTPYRIAEYLQVERSNGRAAIQCTWCGEHICSADHHWKDHAVMRRSSPAQAGPLRVDSARFFLLEFFCPGCATALDVDIVHADDPPLIDLISLWPETEEHRKS